MPPTSTLRSIPVIHVRVVDSFNAMVASCFMAIGSQNESETMMWLRNLTTEISNFVANVPHSH